MESPRGTPKKPVDNVAYVEDPADDGLKFSDAAVDAATRGQNISGYESLSIWETVKLFKIASAACFAAAFSAATDGYQIGYASHFAPPRASIVPQSLVYIANPVTPPTSSLNASIVANKGFVHQFATLADASGKPYLDSPILSGWSSIMSVGQVLGMTTIPFLSSRFGRKVAMYTLWLVLAVSVAVESVARAWPAWLVAKLLAGVGVGCLQSTLPVYIAEVAPVRIRGGLLMCYSFWWTVGTFCAHVALQNLNKNEPYNYLNPIYTQWAQIGLMILIYVFLPESPAWCVNRGDESRAKKCLAWLYRGVPDFDLDRQYATLLMTVEHERSVAMEQKREKWTAIFRGTDGLRTLISLWTNLSQQFIGLTLFATFGTYFFQQAGLQDPFLIKVITSSINIATIIVTIFTADWLGRRWIACGGITLCWVSCAVIGIIGVIKQVRASTYVFVLFACFWNIGMTASGAAGWGFIGEISSQRLRPHTAGFGAACTCVIGIVMNVLVPYMVNANKWNWGLKTGWFYAGVGLPFVIGIWFLIPDTAGRSAAELDELFERKIKPWQFHKIQTATQTLVKQQESEYR
ncbi:sugar transporter [Colletotrichum abscissum]|uniref:sugar transporter n=1 Tax=Colletotrichum abscissum TaxID=1671311 RepID=UPI0027D4C710|nr:sugar transporter [Colletotrichum abscissum]KAK1488814.1 sugar transporter [Colletotrichum abscissum]